MHDFCSIFQNDFLIVGIGSPLRSDDQAGLLFCKELSKRGFKCLECEYGIENCFEEISLKKPKNLIIVDAALFAGGNPGDVIIVPEDSVVADSITTSTHSIPMNTLINLLKIMRITEKVYLIGIYPKVLDIGTDISQEVLVAIKGLANSVEKCLKNSEKEVVE